MENKVSVKIYGQEYTIAGEKSKEHMIKIASHVDVNMHELAKIVKGASVASLAVLSAVNVTDEYFVTLEKLQEEMRLNERLKKDTEHYIQLWDEAKKNFIQQKEETKDTFTKLDGIKVSLNEKDEEIRRLKRELDQAKIKAEQESAEKLAEAKAGYKEIENSFFDLQMENINLKSELDKFKSLSGDF
ncbi:MAG: cell division protein ZapA [Eubacteriales bacterium]|nr:cell division protein ZapA [Eubacteriales bacterium]MDD4389880.1 cell division protein ZapA [Eubacteriales bacterium]